MKSYQDAVSKYVNECTYPSEKYEFVENKSCSKAPSSDCSIFLRGILRFRIGQEEDHTRKGKQQAVAMGWTYNYQETPGHVRNMMKCLGD